MPSLSEELASLTSTAPSIDPELIGWDDAANIAPGAKQVNPSHNTIAEDDPKYSGTTITRSVESDEESVGQEGEEVDEEFNADTGLVESDGDQVMKEEEEEGYNTGDSEAEGSEAEGSEGSDIDQFKQTADNEGAQSAVKFQVELWDKLVQLRLRMQPTLQLLAKLPTPECRQRYMTGDIANKGKLEISSKLQNMIDKLLDLQEQCEKSQGKEEDPDEILSSEDEEKEEEKEEKPVASSRKRKQPFSYYSTLLSNNTTVQEEYRKTVITKWYEKTSLGSQRKTSFMNKEVTTLDQIQHILSDRDRLVKRTKQNRASVKMYGTDEELDSHDYMFNDDDFYQQLLRDVIDRKMGGLDKNDPVSMGKQWVELQRLKVKTKKKRVDNKASKGRKVRYEVHSKLLGFMAPTVRDTVSDTLQDELFGSLFKDKS